MRGPERRKVRVGLVISDKMDKTVVVSVQRQYQHPVYQRVVRQTKKYKVHDDENRCRVGDKVRIVETRPLSKEKRWRVTKVLERATVLAPVQGKVKAAGEETP
ncbi:MAG: 30S ribosomal protein S17 [Candidatus Tectomicrobia bacterium]|uniref:Small ribosomal subunit protein uS17 n=1 Tax=Tectimicrobiota bacterium TaxID=2528274 RepID=A0A932LYG9_UNCTE|nr:30S ribosomal protein S17 [Candidatus Tectomicrobia bacterium]